MAAGRTLGEEQAYQLGKVDGRREALVTLGGAFRKVLTPDSIEALSAALLEGAAKAPGYCSKVSDDPTEPASWPGRGVL